MEHAPQDLDTLSSDSTNSFRMQLQLMNERLDKVQKEVTKSKEEVGENLKHKSPFAPEIRDKPVLTNFRLPILESYNGSSDPTEHVAAFRAQMALYDSSDALMWKGGTSRLVRQQICHRDTGDPRRVSLFSYPSLFDGNTPVQTILVFGRETSDHSPRDDVEGKPLHRCRNSDRRKARGAEASPNGTTPGIHLGIVEEEDRGTRLQPLTTPDDSSQLHADRDFPPNKGQGLLAPPNCIKTQPEERDKGQILSFPP
ncbi:hypothetical protein B296_00024983 [Ensete ventricosum]|uniref:Uncharacterized protein n=1 Tax=Ensete ventricosum TaxID=4639 RepID=A0A426YBM0_ENSVE|nr:hypothetical protein B296_00024983 [Ensete ventricosum]